MAQLRRAGGGEEAQETVPADSGADPIPSSEDGLRWPDEASEAEYLAQERAVGNVPEGAGKGPEAGIEEEEPEQKQALPALQELVERLPASSRELLEELFRARFVAVRKVKKTALK